MARSIAIAGDYNTGKSFSRRSIKEGQKVFVISPNSKDTHLKDSNGEPLKRLSFTTEDGKKAEDIAISKMMSFDSLFKQALIKANNKDKLKFTGNHITTDIYNIKTYLEIIDKHMPEITVVIISDFTHYISKIISSDTFRGRNKGNEAFARYTDLAGDALQNIIISIDSLLREDLIVIKEYHVEYDDNKEEWTIFVPGGKMLSQAFKLPSYYDYLLYTHVEVPEDDVPVTPECYKFVTERYKHYPARFQQLFEGKLIPNSLQLVLEKLSKEAGIKYI